jgi:hypothetical protein
MMRRRQGAGRCRTHLVNTTFIAPLEAGSANTS